MSTVAKRFGDWVIEHDGAGALHCIPVDDWFDHFAEHCVCRPELRGDMHVHHSFDGREKFETGERLPS